MHWPDPKLRWVWLGQACFLALPGILLAIGFAVVATRAPFIAPEALNQALLEFALLSLVVIAALIELGFRRAGVTAQPNAIEVTRGTLIPRKMIVPLASIQDVKINGGPWSRLFGISTLRLITTMGRVKIYGVRDVATALEFLLKRNPPNGPR
ncbi:MAG TPA: PH domain-containing protein [Candidatus Thermoplasmatota archaeon]|nr:PH domain-containing protein [Candidatus Thermoplasmatota archaeon]